MIPKKTTHTQIRKDNQGIKALQKANKTLLNLQKEVYLTFKRTTKQRLPKITL
jgi:hypothetical protein